MANEYFYLNSIIIWVWFCQVQAAICRSMPSLNIDLITTFGNSFPIFIYTFTIHILKLWGSWKKSKTIFFLFLALLLKRYKNTLDITHSPHSQSTQLISMLCCGRRQFKYFSAHLTHVGSAHYCRCSASNSLFCYGFNCVYLIFIRRNVKIEDIFPFLGCERWTFIWPHKHQDTFFLSPHLHSICSLVCICVHCWHQNTAAIYYDCNFKTSHKASADIRAYWRRAHCALPCKSYIDAMPMTASLTRNDEPNQKNIY